MINNPREALSQKVLDIKGSYTALSLSNMINNLFKLSVILQNKRFANGALSLEQPKIHICMEPTIIREQGIPIPINYQLEERRDSNRCDSINMRCCLKLLDRIIVRSCGFLFYFLRICVRLFRLIEEFMLLANMTVAIQLYSKIPETALLRIHRDPIKHSLATACETLQRYGVHLDIETAGALHTSIQRYKKGLLECNSSTINDTMQYIMMVITNMCSKAMTVRIH